MKVRVFTLRWDDAAGKFDDREFRAFIDEDPGRDVLEVSDHFFVHDRRPAWAFMVMFREGKCGRWGEEIIAMLAVAERPQAEEAMSRDA